MGWPSGLREGQDPDPRFTLANERTFLAWIRTALGLVATGAALEAFGADLLPGALRTGLVLGLLVLSAVLAVSAFVRWVRIETAMRRGASLPLPKAAVLVSAGLFVAVVAFTLGLFV